MWSNRASQRMLSVVMMGLVHGSPLWVFRLTRCLDEYVIMIMWLVEHTREQRSTFILPVLTRRLLIWTLKWNGQVKSHFILTSLGGDDPPPIMWVVLGLRKSAFSVWETKTSTGSWDSRYPTFGLLLMVVNKVLLVTNSYVAKDTSGGKAEGCFVFCCTPPKEML